MRFFTSDEHYGHRRVIDFCKRPFKDTDEMREALIAAHNAKVTKGDITYHLGDIFWRTCPVEEALKILDRLNGQHFLVWGNHDELVANSAKLASRFVKLGDIFHLDKSSHTPKIVLCHYSMNVWRGSHNGTWHLYGHSHGALPEPNTLSFDCGVDASYGFAPWSEIEIAEKMAKKKDAGACDPLSKQIAEQPWNKAEGAEVPYPLLTYPMPPIPQEAWDELKKSERLTEAATGSGMSLINRRCVE